MMTMLGKLWKDEEGAAAAEYVLILAIAAIGIIAVLTPYAQSLSNKFSTATTAINTVP